MPTRSMPILDQLVAAVLDTHVWVWCAAGDARAAALARFSGRMIIPAICVWEVAMLAARGRLILQPDTASWVQANLDPPASLEPLTPEIAIESCRLPDFHGDPADRMIVATASVLGLPLITADAAIHKWNRRARRLQLVKCGP